MKLCISKCRPWLKPSHVSRVIAQLHLVLGKITINMTDHSLRSVPKLASYLKSINFDFWDCDCNLTILVTLGLMANLTLSDLFNGSSYTCMTVFPSEDVSPRLFNLLDLSGVRLRECAQNLSPNLAGWGASGAGGFSIYKSRCPTDTFHVVCFMTSCQFWYLYARQCDRH